MKTPARPSSTTIGCASCHCQLQLEDGTPVAVYSDILLHDVFPDGALGVPDGDATIREMRTAPLWGLSRTAPYMHDGRAATIEEAVARHDGEANASAIAFAALSADDRATILGLPLVALMDAPMAPLMARAAPWLLAALLTGCACPGGVELRVESSGGDPKASFCAAIARSEAARMQGLRGHAPLAPGEGLLLAFSIEDELCIVNDGVTFPIDVLYADAAGPVDRARARFPGRRRQPSLPRPRPVRPGGRRRRPERCARRRPGGGAARDSVTRDPSASSARCSPREMLDETLG